MAGSWSSGTSGSDTETGEESLLGNSLVMAFENIAQDHVLNMRSEIVMSAPQEDEVIVLSSDEQTSSDSSSERFSTSYETSSSSMTSEPGSPTVFDVQIENLDHRYFFRSPGEFIPATNPLGTTIGQEHSYGPPDAVEDSSQVATNSMNVSVIRDLIERRLPTISELTPTQVTLSSNRKITADFPNIADISVQSPTAKDWNGCGSRSAVVSPNRKSFKNNPGSPSLVALKRHQASSISEAIWRPDIHKAEVTHRRGKQLESMGSALNPTFLEFYEALYLMTRVKLHLLLPDLTPMAVFDAYNILMRHPEDSELYSIYEFLMDSNAIVVPFKLSKREPPGSGGSLSVEAKSLNHAPPTPSVRMPAINPFSAYEKEDSDSDLEVLSCNMPVSSKSTEVVLAYKQSLPYEGPKILFPKLGVSMKTTALQAIPQELLPECRTVSSELSKGTSNSRIPVSGGHLLVQPHWFTAEGMEEPDWTDPHVVTPKRARKRKHLTKPNPKGSQKKRLKIFPATFPLCFPPQMDTDESMPERYHRRWFPRWFDGVELGVHSLSIVDTLHKFTEDGIPKIDSVDCWSDYKNVFAKLVKESRNHGEDNSLYRGTTTPLMTGTKGNQTQLIFGELLLAQEISESSDFKTRIQEIDARSAHVPHSPKSPKIIFDVYIDSVYSKTKPTTPDYRVVHLKANSVLKISDLMKLSLEAGDATLLIAHVVSGRVRVRQAMMFSIPTYN